jgi:hypothetical protein
MGAESTQVTLQLEAGNDPDALEMDRLTSKLRKELIQLDVDSVARPSEGEAPAGTRGLEILAISTLLIELTRSSEVLKNLVDSVRRWLSSEQERSAKLQIAGDSLEVTGISSSEQERLIAAWIDRHS